MPIVSTLLIATAATTGAFGAGKTAKAVVNSKKASDLNDIANKSVAEAKAVLEEQRKQVSQSLKHLGEEKLYVLRHSVKDFLEAFEQIKNVDFTESTGLEEIKKLKIDKQNFKELKDLESFALSLTEGAGAGLAGGALTAFAAYNGAMALGTASTGTAISTLSGIAAKNATLAWFGGGSLASGGMGMAGGMMVLGSVVAGPALLVMGAIGDAKASQKLETALKNKAEADKIVESLNTASLQCSAIRRRTYMLYNLLAGLDSYFVPQIWNMQDIINNEGTDYRAYKPESKKAIAVAASTACSVKAVLDTPILTKDGKLTKSSEKVVKEIETTIYK